MRYQSRRESPSPLLTHYVRRTRHREDRGWRGRPFLPLSPSTAGRLGSTTPRVLRATTLRRLPLRPGRRRIPFRFRLRQNATVPTPIGRLRGRDLPIEGPPMFRPAEAANYPVPVLVDNPFFDTLGTIAVCLFSLLFDKRKHSPTSGIRLTGHSRLVPLEFSHRYCRSVLALFLIASDPSCSQSRAKTQSKERQCQERSQLSLLDPRNPPQLSRHLGRV